MIATRHEKRPTRTGTRTGNAGRLAALTVIACVTLSACKSDEAPPAEKPPAAKDRSLLDRGKAAKDLALSAGSRGVEFGKSLLGKGKSLGTMSLTEIRKLGSGIVDKAGTNTESAGSHINRLLDQLARDPSSKVSAADRVGRMIILMIPLVGPTKRYADARKLYELGVKTKAPAKMQRARREVLVAFVEAGLDIGALGLVGSRMDLVASGADKLLTTLKLSRTVSVLAGENLRTFDALLDQLLAYKDIRSSVDHALTTDWQ